MNLKRFALLWIALLLALFLPLQSLMIVFAAPSYFVLPVPVVGQGSMTNWCWIACGTSIVKFGGNNISINQFAMATIGNTTSNVTGLLSDVQTGLQHWSISSNAVSNPLTYSTVKNNVYPGRPCIAALRDYSSPPGGHMVVIDGWDETYTLSSERLVEIMDPYGTGSSYFVKFSELTLNSQFYWCESLYNVYY